jgi:hypothetical protein
MPEHYRLSIPIKAETRTALMMLAGASNSTMGQTAGAYLDAMVPQFEQLAKAYTLARTDPAAAARALSFMADAAMDGLAEEQMDLLEAIQPKTPKKRGSNDR